MNMMHLKVTISILFLFITQFSFSQGENNITVLAIGQGKTKDEAKQNAFRSAIEQAFGTFISSKTEVLNDNLIKDEIVSVSNGNIHKFEIVSDVQLPNNEYAVTINTTVSVNRLTSFVKSKGVEIEFEGGLFANDFKQKLLSENAEKKAIFNLCDVSWSILSKSVDYEMQTGKQPILLDKTSELFGLPIRITAKSNSNKKLFNDYFTSTLKNISIPRKFMNSYNEASLPLYKFKVSNFKDTIYLRSAESLIALKNLILWSNKFYFDFSLKSNLDSIQINITNPSEEPDIVGLLNKSFKSENNIFYLGWPIVNRPEIVSKSKFVEDGIANSFIEFTPTNTNNVRFQDIEISSPLWLFRHIYHQIYLYKQRGYEYDVRYKHWLTNDIKNIGSKWSESLTTDLYDQLFSKSGFKKGYYQWYERSDAIFEMQIDTKSVLDITIIKTYSLKELEKLSNYKLIKM
jgi:hypothetical protein